MTQSFGDICARLVVVRTHGGLCPVGVGTGSLTRESLMDQAGITLPISCHVFWQLPASPYVN